MNNHSMRYNLLKYADEYRDEKDLTTDQRLLIHKFLIYVLERDSQALGEKLKEYEKNEV